MITGAELGSPAGEGSAFPLDTAGAEPVFVRGTFGGAPAPDGDTGREEVVEPGNGTEPTSDKEPVPEGDAPLEGELDGVRPTGLDRDPDIEGGPAPAEEPEAGGVPVLPEEEVTPWDVGVTNEVPVLNEKPTSGNELRLVGRPGFVEEADAENAVGAEDGPALEGEPAPGGVNPVEGDAATVGLTEADIDPEAGGEPAPGAIPVIDEGTPPEAETGLEAELGKGTGPEPEPKTDPVGSGPKSEPVFTAVVDVTVDVLTTGKGDVTAEAEADSDAEVGADGTPDPVNEKTLEAVSWTDGDMEAELAGNPEAVTEPVPAVDPDAVVIEVTVSGAPPELCNDESAPEGTVLAVTVVIKNGSVTVITGAETDADSESG